MPHPRAYVWGPSAPQAPAWPGEGAQACLWNCMGTNLVQAQLWGKENRLRVKLVWARNTAAATSAISKQTEAVLQNRPEAAWVRGESARVSEWRQGRWWCFGRGRCRVGEANWNAHSKAPRLFHLNGCVNGSRGAGIRGLSTYASVYCTGCK